MELMMEYERHSKQTAVDASEAAGAAGAEPREATQLYGLVLSHVAMAFKTV